MLLSCLTTLLCVKRGKNTEYNQSLFRCLFEDPNYNMKSLAEQYQEDLREGGFDLINFGLTWNNETSIDHAFCNKPESVKNCGIIMTRHFSDHNLIHVELETNLSRITQETIVARDMRKIRANPQYFINSLLSVEWDKLANMVWDVYEMVNFYTKSIISSLDKTSEMKERKFKAKK